MIPNTLTASKVMQKNLEKRTMIAARSLFRVVGRSLSTQLKPRGIIGGSDIYPREREGNIYDDNFSLNVDGIVSTADAYRNARISLLTAALPSKVVNGAVEISKLSYHGKYEIKEAGDSVSHDQFNSGMTKQCEHFSSGISLYIEDASVGTYRPVRVGVRVVTDSPALALVTRKLLLETPSESVNHFARFDGWNIDPNMQPEIEFVDGKYERITKPKKGQRPILALVGGSGDKIAVQFCESNKKIIGANVTIGEATPVRGIIDAIGFASTVVMNALSKDMLAVPSVAISKGSNTAVIINGDDSVLDMAVSKNVLYGPYHNALSALGVSALWGGYIGNANAAANSDVPVVVSGGKGVVSSDPNNMAMPAKEIYFYEKGASKKVLTEEEATKKLVELTDESKKELIATLLKGVTVTAIGSPSDAF